MALKSTNAAPEGESQVNQRLQKGGVLNYVLFFLLIGVTLYGVFLSFDKGRIMANTLDLESQTRDLQTQVDTIKGNKIEVSQNASEALKKIEAEELRWSEIITEVQKLIPQDTLGQRQVQVLSYSGSSDGKVTLNMVTMPASLPPFADVSRIISIFNNSVFFREAYVPSIAKGTDESGLTTLSFMLNTSYQKADTGSESLPLTTVTTDGKVPAVKVPRTN
jgi:hypothetical protein